MRIAREGITHAMTNMAISIPQNTIWLPKKNAIAACDEATPSAQKAEMRRPINMRTYTLRITALTCVASAFCEPPL